MLPILSMKGQLLTFLLMCAAGFVTGLGYDVLRAGRRAARHGLAAVFLEDVLFWTLAALWMFYAMLNGDFAEMRAFDILGAALGAVLYFCSLSRLFLRLTGIITRALKKAADICIRRPFIKLKRGLRKMQSKAVILWRDEKTKRLLKRTRKKQEALKRRAQREAQKEAKKAAQKQKKALRQKEAAKNQKTRRKKPQKKA